MLFIIKVVYFQLIIMNIDTYRKYTVLIIIAKISFSLFWVFVISCFHWQSKFLQFPQSQHFQLHWVCSFQFQPISQLKFFRHQFSNKSHDCFSFFCSVSDWVLYSASWLALDARKTDTRATPARCHELWWLWRQMSHVHQCHGLYDMRSGQVEGSAQKNSGRSSGEKMKVQRGKNRVTKYVGTQLPDNDKTGSCVLIFHVFLAPTSHSPPNNTSQVLYTPPLRATSHSLPYPPLQHR